MQSRGRGAPDWPGNAAAAMRGGRRGVVRGRHHALHVRHCEGGRAGRGGAGRAGRGGRSDAGRSARRFACVKQAIGRHVSYGQATPPPRTPEGDAPVLIVGTRMPAAPRSSACCIPPRSCGPSTRTSACCPPAALTAVSMAAMHA